MPKPLLLILVLLAPLLAASCEQGSDSGRDNSRGPYVSGGFGGH